MHHATAVRRLRTIAESCQELMGFPVDEPIMHSAYAFGAVLEGAGDQDFVQVVFVLDVPTDELTWGTRPRSHSWLWHQLRLDRTPVDSYWRPAAWPVSNHVIVRPLRIWSTDGVDDGSLDALARGEAEPLRLAAPSREELAAQLATELTASLEHLKRVRDGFWERDWRAEHKGGGIYPEQDLWDAAHGYLDLLEAVKAGRTLTITGHGRVVATLSPATDADEPRGPRPRIGGYRSERALSAEEINVELAAGFGDDDRR